MALEPMQVQLHGVEELHRSGMAAAAERRRRIADAETALFARARAIATGAPLRGLRV